VRDGALTWEIDHFLDRDLTLAEVELETADAKPAPPDWLQPHVVREVTDDAAYLNYNLAR
jgi:CYTH domain-containing protein